MQDHKWVLNMVEVEKHEKYSIYFNALTNKKYIKNEDDSYNFIEFSPELEQLLKDKK